MLTKEICLEAVNVLEKINANSFKEIADIMCSLSVIDTLIEKHFELKERYIELECEYGDMKEFYRMQIDKLKEDKEKENVD